MISNCKKFFAAAMTGVMLLSSASCGMIEMRDSDDGIIVKEETVAVMLEPAERKNTVETRSETEITVAEEPAAAVTVCLTGNISIDENIINDASNRATEGKSYSFVRMYAGVFRNVCSADIAFGSYVNDSSSEKPVESLAALSDVGFDVFRTSDAENNSVYADYGISGVNSSKNISYIEKNGLTVAFVSLDNADAGTVRTAADNSDAVVVHADWTEICDSKAAARDFAAAGADVIVGNGSVLGEAEWIDTGDGSPALCAYSLGNLIATSDAPYELCGGILEFTFTEKENGCAVNGVVISPSVVRYTYGYADYQLVMLEDYSYELSAEHAVREVNPDVLLPYVRQAVSVEFLDPDLRG